MLDEKERKEQEEKERLRREKEARKYCKLKNNKNKIYFT
jgi:hypothetical protein